ncbi:MAG: HD domain-containing protein [Candidatus Methanomethyliaceae archaeon]
MLAATQLDLVRMSAILHDIGKLECWSKRRPWSEHVFFTFNFVKKCLGEELAWHARRHHVGPSYSEVDRPCDELEKIISLADHLASGADRRDQTIHGPPLPSPPIELAHPLSKEAVMERLGAADLAYILQEIAQRLGNLEKGFAEDPKKCYFQVFEILKSSGLRRVPADTRKPVNDVSLWDHLKLTAAISTCITLEGFKGDNPNHYKFAILSGDSDRISAFINQSRRLPDLNARSQLVKDATSQAVQFVCKELGPECVLFSAGGSVLVISPTNLAEKLLYGIKRTFESAANDMLTMTVSSIVVDGVELSEDFGHVWESARTAMRIAKGRRIALPKVFVEEGVDLCDVCGIRPYTKEDLEKILPFDASPRYERLCEPCWSLRKRGKGVWLDELKDSNGLVGCVRMDGDNVGAVLSGKLFRDLGKASTPSRISTVSALIQRICEDSFKGVLGKFNGERGIIFAGGDDLLAFVPGKDSLAAALELASDFKEKTAGACTISAGVAIFHYDLPVYVGLESANALLRRAKEGGKNRVAFAFLRGSAVGESELERFKPRTWDELKHLIDLTKFMGMGGVSSSQLRSFASVRDPEYAEILIKNRMGRGRIGWEEGEGLLSALKSGLLTDAFLVYKTLEAS